MTEDQKLYEAAIVTKLDAEYFINQPRCITCEHYQTGGRGAACVMHGPVPVEYLYTPNECADYEIVIPF